MPQVELREAAKSGGMAVDRADVEAIQELYDRGLFVQALSRAEPYGPLADWQGVEARILAGRLAFQLGNVRLGFALHRLAWRDHPGDARARYFHILAVLARWGPFAAWQRIRTLDEPGGGPSKVQSDWIALKARIAAYLRDFDRADALIASAEVQTPANPWTAIEKATVLEIQDRFEEALASARQTLELRPWYCAGVLLCAHLLQLLGRDQEAVELLTEAAGRLESYLVCAQLASAQTELGNHEAAWSSLERASELAVLKDKRLASSLAGERSNAAYHLGRYEEARQLAEQSDEPFFEKIARRLEHVPPEARRVQLEVDFVRQHHMTCAPATLTAISRFWSMPADHLEVAEAICYDGTPGHSERHWAETHGWRAREFTVTWDSAVALIDAGVPFTLTTVDLQSAHLQAVIGYDSRRGTFIIRDPMGRHAGEALAEAFLNRFRATGPRGMALVPANRSGLLDRMDLPDAERYDRYHEIQRALVAHDREAARRAFEPLASTSPDHRLTLQARLSLAEYDADQTARMEAVDRLNELFPDEPTFRLFRLSGLRMMGRRQDRLDILEGMIREQDVHPVIWQQYAQELGEDARRRPRALSLLWRALRRDPQNGGTHYILANQLWAVRRFEDALEAYRFATCLADKEEQFAQSWFTACRHFQRTEEALEFLTGRIKRYGAKSSLPARTLFQAYSMVNRTREGFAVLDEALGLHPDDGELLTFAAEMNARFGRIEAARSLLERAESKSARSTWLRAAANVARIGGDRDHALALLQEVIAREPLAVDAHANAARLLAETRGRAAALDHIRSTVDRYPHNVALHELWLEWIREEDPEEAETVVRRMVAINPANAWARRELAFGLARSGRLEEARAEAETARELDPSAPAYFNLLGTLHMLEGRVEEARPAFKESIRLNADEAFAIDRLVSLAGSPEEYRDGLEFVRRELMEQAIHGDGLLAYVECARLGLEPEALRAALEEFKENRSDLWQAWSVLINQTAGMDRLDEAGALAEEAVVRFPLLPQLRMDLAGVCRLRADRSGEIAVLEETLETAPDFIPALRALADAYQAAGDFPAAISRLDRAIERNPLDAVTHGFLAEALWKSGEAERAIQHAERAAVLDPDYDWAWARLKEWCDRVGCPERPVERARELTEKQGGRERSWLVLAVMLSGFETIDERLKAVDRAIELDPRRIEAHNLRSGILVEARRFEEAFDACRPAVFGEHRPAPLMGQEAWVESERGDLERAIRCMEGAVKADPLYLWGWAKLAEWYRAVDRRESFLEAAEHWVELQPNHPLALRCRGEARERNGDTKGARSDLERALALQPDFEEAAESLLGLCFESDDLAGAEALLERIAPHQDRHRQIVFRIRLAVKRGDPAAAQAALEALAKTDASGRESCAEAVHVLVGSGYRNLALDTLSRVLRDEDSSPHGAALLVQQRLATGEVRAVLRLLRDLRARPELWQAAAMACLEAAPGFRQWRREKEIRGFIRRERTLLAGNGDLWGQTGWALLSIGDVAPAVAWLDGWEGREGVEPWMVLNRIVALTILGRVDEAVEVGSRASALAPDHSYAMHRVMQTFGLAFQGEIAKAGALAAELDHGGLSDDLGFLLRLSEAMLVAASGPHGFVEARKRLRIAAAAFPPYRHETLATACFRLAVKRIAEARGGLGAAIWSMLARGLRRAV
jgi:tetratricopeptide (TPR) repeat protein